ncbi:MAG: DUF948 domain-containing protein [Eubacteriaceae bacterium]|jgi:uncharacterized protein YoxC
MITFSMSWWELALMIIAIAIVFGTVALVKLLKSVNATVNTAEDMLKENRRQLDSIIENVDGITNQANDITAKANVMTDNLEQTMLHVEEDVINPMIAVLSKVSKILGILKKK